MKRGPLLRFLQNLPELHPHPLFITAVSCLDASARRLPRRRRRRHHKRKTQRVCRNRFLPWNSHFTCEKPTRRPSINMLRVRIRPKPTHSSHKTAVHFATWFLSYALKDWAISSWHVVIIYNCYFIYFMFIFVWSCCLCVKRGVTVLCHRPKSCIRHASQAPKSLRKIKVTLFTALLFSELKYFAFLAHCVSAAQVNSL